MTFKVSRYNRKWTPVLKKTYLIKLYCVWSNMVTLNKTHITILVCAADGFRKYQKKMQKLRFLKKNHNKSVISKNSSVWVFFKSARRFCNHLNFNSIKTALKTHNFYKNSIFAFLNPKIVK